MHRLKRGCVCRARDQTFFPLVLSEIANLPSSCLLPFFRPRPSYRVFFLFPYKQSNDFRLSPVHDIDAPGHRANLYES